MTRRLREATLWAGAALGLLSVVAGTAVMFFGFTFLIFRSGSMGPEVPTGSLALAKTVPAAELAAGDVVSVLAANGARITHRVVGTTVRGDEASLILQGDANGTPDEEIYQVTEAQRAIVSLPYAGYVVTVLLSPAGLLASVCLSGMLMLLAFGTQPTSRGGGPTPPGGKHRGQSPVRSRRALVGAGAVAAVALSTTAAGLGVSGTSAYFTDQATVTGSNQSFTAATIATPATPSTRRQLLSVTVSWTPETPVGATKVTRYEVLRYATATGGTGTTVCSTTAPTLSCTDTSPTLLPSYYAVVARIGTNWTNVSARTLCCTDNTAPSVTIVAPPADSYEKRDDLRDVIKDACEPLGTDKNTPACGRATDPSGVAKVQYQLQRRPPGLLSTTQCYNDVTETWGGCTIPATYRDALVTTSGNTDVIWELRNDSKKAYDKDIYTYTLSIIATDGLGNVSTATSVQYSVTTDK